MELFDLHYPRDAGGKIRFEPAQSLETWHEAVNPLPEIAGLRYTLGKLLQLPNELSPDAMTEARQKRWTRLLSELPPLPATEKKMASASSSPRNVSTRRKTQRIPNFTASSPIGCTGSASPIWNLR